jgi:hypothetical protein
MNEKPEGYDAAHREAYSRLAHLATRLQTKFAAGDVSDLFLTIALAVRLVHVSDADAAAWLRSLADDVEAGERQAH